ncbi:MAG: hypothetical protein ACLFVJ_02020 [Persicimonas sp.]
MRLKQLIFCVFIAAALGVGCASGSQSTSAEDEDVSASPPSADEDTRGELPEGPEVNMGRTGEGEGDGESKAGDEADDAGGEAKGTQQVVTGSQLDAFIEKGPSFALTQVEVAPRRKDGSFQGFQLVSMRPSAQESVGEQLRLGDIITHINGVRLEKPDDYLDAWKLLGEVSSIRIDFIRDGQAQHALWRVE